MSQSSQTNSNLETDPPKVSVALLNGEKVIVMSYSHAQEVLAGLVQEDHLKEIRELYIKAHDSSMYTDSLQQEKIAALSKTIDQQAFIITLDAQDLDLAEAEIRVLKKKLRRAKLGRMGQFGITLALGGYIVYDAILK